MPITRAAILKKLPFLYGVKTKTLQSARLLWHGGAKGLFRNNYKTNYWGSGESLSGPGSTIQHTENLRMELPKLLRRHRIASMLDAPCGDFHWFQRIELPENVAYIGGDIVPEMIERNQELYGNPGRRFMVLDITRDRPPDVDLWMCRDVLLHLSNASILRMMANFLKSNVRYLLASTQYEIEVNVDAVTGDARPVNPEKAPFFLPPPIDRVEDCASGTHRTAMALWPRDAVASAFAQNDAAPKSLRTLAQEALRAAKTGAASV